MGKIKIELAAKSTKDRKVKLHDERRGVAL